MDLKLKGKTALITGSTSGIGLATARCLANEGARVLINGRSEENVNSACNIIRKLVKDSDPEGVVADLSSPEGCDVIISTYPHVDILINNLGIYSSIDFYTMTDDEWYRQFEVNVMSGVRLSRHYLPSMMDTRWGRILFVSSECASLVPGDLIAYSMTKAAIHAVSRGLAQLTKGSDVTVNTIMPGSTLSEGAKDFLVGVARKEGKEIDEVESDFFKKVRTSSLLQRFATVDEVASTIAYYSSPLSSATNGANIKVDGGSTGGIF